VRAMLAITATKANRNKTSVKKNKNKDKEKKDDKEITQQVETCFDLAP
jgi:hypothetical protein